MRVFIIIALFMALLDISSSYPYIDKGNASSTFATIHKRNNGTAAIPTSAFVVSVTNNATNSSSVPDSSGAGSSFVAH
ncbi:hypothetical protein SPOG_01602 [Schizosaccharomyces cryophilus OY26]|uniref:Uncharacterized protein n=1 Tax=Schizosaccharomyces cryophilus (strain OY26 / ATCC MYA-4695 / CBS 11777 / NBRC 106824 / NRRL Y48691) TaxID=653667 RepID=S9VX59_SCHCR|nr:uncharacterized protein SPOG_01602 [Schizosaccharomyces cryophilus OY26]EPY52263.1 hypothetical protein SPOG_01602 [Schizosaccharomyces cryophilus OY26]